MRARWKDGEWSRDEDGSQGRPRVLRGIEMISEWTGMVRDVERKCSDEG